MTEISPYLADESFRHGIVRVPMGDAIVFLYDKPWIEGAVIARKRGNLRVDTETALAMLAAAMADDYKTVRSLALDFIDRMRE